MTSIMKKPRYIDPADRTGSASLPANPPFSFREVTARVFPIKANIARLHGFCDYYLNMNIPRRIAHFRPGLPYVYVMVLNYGKMSVESVRAQNLGWVSQHEVTFTVPLTWWREERGRLVFKDWACVSPFIFVDDVLSQTTGREVYGWPKVAARVEADTPLWTEHPRSPSRLFTLSTHVFPKLYAGEREALRVLMQIHRDPAPSYSEFPPDPDNPWGPLSSLPSAVRASLGLMEDAVDMFAGLRMRGYQRGPGSLLRVLTKSGWKLTRLLPGFFLPALRTASGTANEDFAKLYIDQVTLKQFRDAERPSDACYQALVRSRMGFDRLNQGGLLGDVNLLRGDPSGGFTIRIHRYLAQPIVETLGMQVTRVEDGDQTPVDILKPTFPFWTDVDLDYGKGEVICSRIPRPCDDPSENWVDEQDAKEVKVPTGKQQGDVCRIPYNTARGGATQPIAGPFHFPDVTLQVYPLLAERATLQGCLDRYLNVPLDPLKHRFEAFGSYVYLMVNVYGGQVGTMWSEANNIGWWADREVSFCVPVKWYRNDKLISLALVSPFVFANSGRAVTTDREVNGRPAVKADIERPEDPWLTTRGPEEGRRLLKLEADVFPALHLGQQAERRTLIEIDGNCQWPYDHTQNESGRDDVRPDTEDAGWQMVSEKWGDELRREVKHKAGYLEHHETELRNAKAMALEILAHGAPVNWIHVKQYRDACETQTACYQAVVHTRRSITPLRKEIQEIKDSVAVRLHKYPGQPIAETLGLKIAQLESSGGSVVQSMQPIQPFWMHMSVKEELGKVLCSRAIDRRWNATHPWSSPDAPPESVGEAPYFDDVKAPQLTRVGVELAAPGKFQHHIKRGADLWLRQSLYEELKEALRSVREDFSAKVRGEWGSYLDVELKREWSRMMEEHPSVEEFGASLTTEQLRKLADAFFSFQSADEARMKPAKPPKRLSRKEARDSIEILEDVQILIESILSDPCEDGGDGRR